MIVEQNRIDASSFIDVFTKKFQNFCTRVPLFISYDVTPTSVTIYQHVGNGDDKKEIYTYNFNFSKDVKENIYYIRKYLLENYYPVMLEIESVAVKYSGDILNQMISEGKISLDDVDQNGFIYQEVETRWRIEKVIMPKDQVFIRNLTTNEVKRFKLRLPSSFFINKITNEITDEEDRWILFEDKSKFIGDSYDVDAHNNIIQDIKRS